MDAVAAEVDDAGDAAATAASKELLSNNLPNLREIDRRIPRTIRGVWLKNDQTGGHGGNRVDFPVATVIPKLQF